MGTEMGLSFLEPVNFQDAVPDAHEPCLKSRLVSNDVDEFSLLEDSTAETISLQNCIPTPDLLHIIHNAGAELYEANPLFDETIDELSAVTHILSDENKERLCQTCFGEGRGLYMQRGLKKCPAQVYKLRWEVCVMPLPVFSTYS